MISIGGSWERLREEGRFKVRQDWDQVRVTGPVVVVGSGDDRQVEAAELVECCSYGDPNMQ